MNDEKQLVTSLYDKKDEFKFDIINFPFLHGNVHSRRSHGVIVSQLIRYARICLKVEDFSMRVKSLRQKLVKQDFDNKLLYKKFSNFFDKYFHLIEKYEKSKSDFKKNIFEL